MPGDAERIPKPSLLSLFRAIVDDAKQLVIGQYELRKYQTLHQIDKAKAMAIWAGIGIALTVIGAIMLILMVVHLLHDILNLPLWGSYGIVGLVLVVAGGGCLYGAKTRR